MKQKFPAFSFVHVQKEMPEWKSHFDSDFDAIVLGSYSQLYGGDNIKSYSVAMTYEGVIINVISWYDDDQLSLLEKQDSLMAQEMVEEYHLKTLEWGRKVDIARKNRFREMYRKQ